MKRRRGTIRICPNPMIFELDEGLGEVKIAWQIENVSTVEVRVGSVDGPLLCRAVASGTCSTGRWVHSGMKFFLQDVSDGLPLKAENTLAMTTAYAARTGPRNPRWPVGLLRGIAPLLPARYAVGLMTVARGGYLTPAQHRVRFGHLRRLTPISRVWGFDRGQPIDRYYIDQFLQDHQKDISGVVLEVDDNAYTTQYGGGRVSRSDVISIEEQNPKATLIADITRVDQVPLEMYDCIVFTQTLQLIFELRMAVESIWKMLKPGGCVLVTVPGITPTGDAAWGEYWNWSFTPQSVRMLFAKRFEMETMTVRAYGNVLTATALLHGLAATEFQVHELEYCDPSYSVTIGLRAVKKLEVQ